MTMVSKKQVYICLLRRNDGEGKKTVSYLKGHYRIIEKVKKR